MASGEATAAPVDGGAGGEDVVTRMLRSQPVLILDGAQGTELERRGIDLTGLKLWSAQMLLDDPAVVRDIHLAYLRAGADVITTFTYQASMEGLQEAAGLTGDAADEVVRRGLDLAVQARDAFWQEHTAAAAATAAGSSAEGGGPISSTSQPPPPPSSSPSAASAPSSGAPAGGAVGLKRGVRQRPLVAFSLGSYGAYLADGSEFRGMYAETVPHDRLADFHRRRLAPVRTDPRADLLAFETVPCLAEAAAIVALLSEDPPPSAPAWVSLSCRDGSTTCHGESFADEVVPLLAACPSVVAIGVNCTSPEHVGPLLAAARAKLDELRDRGLVRGPKHLLTYPNSGETFDGQTRCWEGEAAAGMSRPEGMAAAARDVWVAKGGAELVGGCCRTTPEHIAALRAVLLGGPGQQ